mgnify:CR=1 FL=1
MADKALFAEEALRYAPQLLSTALRMTRNRSDAEDLVQETMLKAYRSYDSFQPVVDFVEQAARDPQVLAIKQTLYRTSGDSPIINALIKAAHAGRPTQLEFVQQCGGHGV